MSYNSKYTGVEVEALLDAANGKQDKIEDLGEIREGASKGATALQSVPSEYVTESELMWIQAEGEAGVRLKGTNGTATGNLAISAGDDKTASDGTAFTSAASGDHAVAFGFGNTCSGRTTLAQGLYNIVSGKDSVAFGQKNTVNGDQAFAAGQQNEVTTRLGVAIGYKNKATNTDSIAIGYQNTSGGSASVAMGDSCEANGTSSTAMGYKTKATGAYSSTFGENTQATNNGEVAMGLYNKSTTSTDTSEQTLFSFGIGTSDTDRVNAFEIKKNGDVYIGDKLMSGGGITAETDPLFSASPAASITNEKMSVWDGKQDAISDLNAIRSGAEKGATALQSYTEKYTGTYSKPSGGIPKTDLASAVQTSLGKADTALQTHQDISGKQDIVSGLTQYAWDAIVSETGKISGKQDKLTSGTNIKTINGASILGSGDISISASGGGTITGVSANGTSIATSGVANIPAASTSAYGVTKLSTSTSSTSTTLAATASAVKSAYDLANSYKGTVTGVKVNGETKNPSSGTVDIGNVVTSIKINGSIKTPSSGVIDLGSISGGTSSGDSSSTDTESIELDPNSSFFNIVKNGLYILKGNINQDYEFSVQESCRIIIGAQTYGSISFYHPTGGIYWANDNAPELEDDKIMEFSFFVIMTGAGVYSVLGVWSKYDTYFVNNSGDY